MKRSELYKEPKINPLALPLFLEGGETALLILHGYLGSPYEVSYLAERLNRRGYTVSVPRLPGHGTDGNDFLKTGKREWLRKAYDSFLELKSSYKRVYLIGFSMGGLLAIITAASLKTDKLILIAPALTNRRRLRLFLTPLMKFFFKKIRKKSNAGAFNSFEEYLKEVYWSYDWIKASSDILSLQIEARKKLSLLKAEVLLLISENDKTVPLKVSEIVRKRVKSSLLTEKRLSDSGHIIFRGTEKEKGAEIIINWLDSNI